MKKLLLSTLVATLGVGTLFAADPVFPDRLDVKANGRSAVIDQYFDDDMGDDGALVISVSGTVPSEELVLTFDLPEGWDGVIGCLMATGGWLRTRSSDEWPTIDQYKQVMAGMDIVSGTSLAFKADGENYIGNYFLFADGKVDVEHGFVIQVLVTQAEDPELVFPAEFDITANSSGIVIDQYIDEDTDAQTVGVTGTTNEEEVVLNFNLPEGWDGVIGYEQTPQGLKKVQSEWPTIDQFEAMMAGQDITKGKTLTFPADGEFRMGMYFLYSGDRVDVDHGFVVHVQVEKKTPDSVETVEAENGAVRYFNLLGGEVKNPRGGVYVKVSGDKSSKVVIK